MEERGEYLLSHASRGRLKRGTTIRGRRSEELREAGESLEGREIEERKRGEERLTPFSVAAFFKQILC